MDGRTSPPMRTARATVPAGVLAFVLAAGTVSEAAAQVIEVGPSGITTINGPVVVTPDGVKPIRPSPRQTARTARQAAAEPFFITAGGQVELSPKLLEAVAYVESRFNQQAVSKAGAVGVMQLMPATAAELGVDPTHPEGNIRGGAEYLRRMVTLFGNNLELALAAYNAGPSAVQRYGGVPPYAETRAYVDAVMDYLARTDLSETD
jgi:soluble lytic murein transglycosylase-like protein